MLRIAAAIENACNVLLHIISGQLYISPQFPQGARQMHGGRATPRDGARKECVPHL
jgi:hypothetical protein